MRRQVAWPNTRFATCPTPHLLRSNSASSRSAFESPSEGDWRIIGNGSTKLGLFAEHIEENILTFNPGMAQDYEPTGEGLPDPLPDFTDVREIERRLIDAGITLDRATETEAGPDFILLTDPNGNQLMIDQFY